MKIIHVALLIVFIFSASPVFAKTVSPVSPKPTTSWKPAIPTGYSPITWAKAPGIATFFKAPEGNGSIDFITRIYLPQNQIGFIGSTSTPLDWGVADPNFAVNTSSTTTIAINEPFSEIETTTTINLTSTSYHNFAFARLTAETAKATASSSKFIWNAPFFNITNSISDLSLALKTTVDTSTLITSGSRPAFDMAEERRMLIINNQKGTASIQYFDPITFVSSSVGDQAVEGFAPTVAKMDNMNGATGRLFLGVPTSSKELVIYCSQQATVREASDALLTAGVPIERQMEVDGGGSAACGYNLPGQFFVEPTRTLPLLMGAVTILARGTATTKDLNVRRGPSTKFSIVKKLAKGEAVRVYEEKSGWFRIGDGQWVLGSLIKKI